MKSASTNTFNDGLVRDLNELTTPDKVMTYCLNGTLVTFNGNEFSLQNDMGNARIGTAYLPDGYVPVGMKEYGGIIYVASYNPQTKKGQIGSFPSPKRLFSDSSGGSSITLNDTVIEWRPVNVIEVVDETETIKEIDYPFIINDYYGKEITDDILHNGDWFALTSDIGTSYDTLIDKKILTIDLAVKTDNRLIPIEKILTGIPFTNIETGDLQKNAIQIITNAEYKNINIFNSKYSGSLYYILNYKTLEDWNINTQVEKGTDEFILTYTYNYIINNNSEIEFGGAVYEDLNDSSKYTDITKHDKDNIILTQTVPKNSSINGYLIPYTNYGVLDRLKLAIGYTYDELEEGLDKLTEYYYEYKQGSIPEEDYIYLRIGYQYLSWTDDVFSGLRLKIYDLDSPDKYNKIITEEGVAKKNPLITLNIDSEEGIFNRSEIVHFRDGFIKNKIYIVEIYKIINNEEKLVSIKTMYTSPIINSIGYNNHTCYINIVTNNIYNINNEETYYSTLSKESNIESIEYKNTEISIDDIRNIYINGKLPITYIKHIDKYKLRTDITNLNTSINNNIYNNDELCVSVVPNIKYTSTVDPINNSQVQISDNTVEVDGDELTLTQYKYIYSTITQKLYNGSVKQLRRAFNPLSLDNSNIGTRMVANPTSYITGDSRTTYSGAFDINECKRIIHIFGLRDAGNCVIEEGKGVHRNDGEDNDIDYFNSLNDCCSILTQDNEKATMCFGYSYKSWEGDQGNPFSVIYEGTGRDSGSADDAKGIDPNKNFFRFNNRAASSDGYDKCINYSSSKANNNQSISMHTDCYYQFVALKTYDPLNYSDGYNDSSNWAIIDLFRYGKEEPNRPSTSIIYDSFTCDIAYAAYVYFSQILVPVKIEGNKNVWTIDNIVEDERDVNVNINIKFKDDDKSIVFYNGNDYASIIKEWEIAKVDNNTIDTKFISYEVNDNSSFIINNKCDILSPVKNIYTIGKEPFMPDLNINDNQIYLLNLGDNEDKKLDNLLNLPTIIDNMDLVKDVKMEGATIIEDPKIEEFNQIAGIGETTGASLSYLRDWLVPESYHTNNLDDFNPLYIKRGTKGIGNTDPVKQMIFTQYEDAFKEGGDKEPGPLFIHFGFSDKSSYLSRSYN